MSYIESLHENLSNINIEELPTELKKKENDFGNRVMQKYYQGIL